MNYFYVLTLFPGGGCHKSPPLQKIAHISGNFYGRCLNSSDFSWFGLTSNIKKELEHLSCRLFFYGCLKCGRPDFCFLKFCQISADDKKCKLSSGHIFFVFGVRHLNFCVQSYILGMFRDKI